MLIHKCKILIIKFQKILHANNKNNFLKILIDLLQLIIHYPKRVIQVKINYLINKNK